MIDWIDIDSEDKLTINFKNNTYFHSVKDIPDIYLLHLEFSIKNLIEFTKPSEKIEQIILNENGIIVKNMSDNLKLYSKYHINSVYSNIKIINDFLSNYRMYKYDNTERNQIFNYCKEDLSWCKSPSENPDDNENKDI